MKKLKNTFIFFLSLLIVFFTIISNTTNTSSTSLPSISYEVIGKAMIGNTINIAINVSNINDFYGGSIDFDYDDELLEVLSITNGDIFNDNEILTPLGVSGKINKGNASFALTLKGNATNTSRNKTFVNIKAKVLKEGKLTLKTSASNNPLLIGDNNCRVKLSNSNGKSIKYLADPYMIDFTSPVVSVTGVSLNNKTLSLTKGKTALLSATVLPSNAANKNVAWTSSNTKIASVDNDGKVTAVAPGTATITVKTKDGSKTASCTVTVLNVFSKLEVKAVNKNSTAITGVGLKDAKVTAYVDGKSIGSVTAASNGNYSIKIPKQAAGKEITVKMTKAGYEAKSAKTTVLNVFGSLTIKTANKNSTTITGTGTKTAKVTAYVDGKSIGSATVASNGNYSIKIPKQAAGKEITVKMTKAGYETKSAKTTVQNVFGTLTVNEINKNSTAIKGTGTKGAKVTAYVDGKSIGSATIASNGTYSIKIAKQAANKEVSIKMTKSGYLEKSVKTKVLNVFTTFTSSNLTKTSTSVSGKGTSGATVKVYVNNKEIAKATVNSKGAYSAKIAKQKAGTKVVVKMSKSGYTTASKTITVK